MASNNTTVGTDKGKNARKHEDESGIDESSVHLQMNRSGPESVGVRFRREPESGRQLSILTSKSKEHVVKDSEFEEPPLPDKVRKQTRLEMQKLAIEELKGEFKQMVMEAARQGAQLAINGENVEELQQELENKERKLLKLKKEKKELENDLSSQKEKNEELELLVDQKERQIKILETEVKNIEKILNTQKKELEKEEALRKKKEKKEEALRKIKEDKLLSEIKGLKETCDKLKIERRVKISAGNISKTELQRLREKIAEMEGKLKEHKNKKS